ncbi:MAG: homoserine dehydrogenase [Acidimicrobiia bacterium]
MRKVNIGLVGCGVVGSSLVTQLHEKHQRIIDEFNIDIRITKVLVRNKNSSRDVPSKSKIFSNNDSEQNFIDVLTEIGEDISDNKDIDLVVEVAGGVDDAYAIISSSLKNSKSVVTANKALLALKGNELYSTATQNGVDLLFEAAVGGGVPLIRPIRESLAVEHINSVKGILNGTTNYILSQMTANSLSYGDALSQAQQLGYAEADPTADVEGHDAAAKIAIISLLAAGANALQSDVKCIGISNVTDVDIQTAKDLGYVIKLIATVQEKNQEEVFLRVEPTLVPMTHPFSTVHDGFNAVFVEGEKLGEAMFYGRGAGGDPTASAVLGDVIDASINIAYERKGSVVGFAFDRKIADPRNWESCFYISIDVVDQPGVLAQVTKIFGEHKISIGTMHQLSRDDNANIILLTHKVEDGSIQDAVQDLEKLDVVKAVKSVFPIL